MLFQAHSLLYNTYKCVSAVDVSVLLLLLLTGRSPFARPLRHLPTRYWTSILGAHQGKSNFFFSFSFSLSVWLSLLRHCGLEKEWGTFKVKIISSLENNFPYRRSSGENAPEEKARIFFRSYFFFQVRLLFCTNKKKRKEMEGWSFKMKTIIVRILRPQRGGGARMRLLAPFQGRANQTRKRAKR